MKKLVMPSAITVGGSRGRSSVFAFIDLSNLNTFEFRPAKVNARAPSPVSFLILWEAVVGAEVVFGRVVPEAFAHGFVSGGVQGIDDAIVGLGSLADYEQARRCGAVVDEGMRDAGACGESHGVSRCERVQMTIDPHAWGPFDHVRELFLATLGMRP